MSANDIVQTVHRFRVEREPTWERLEDLLDRARKGLRRLDDDELAELPVLYRATLSSLSVARDTSLDKALVAYLEALSARAYFFVYGTRARLSQEVWRFFARDWPAAARALWRETLIAVALLGIGALVGWLLVANDPSWFSAFVPPDLAGGRDPSASAAFLKKTLYDAPKDGASGLGVMSAYLFTHNAGIAIACFALGFLVGVPTILLLIQTGAMLGAILQLFFAKGLGPGIMGWLFIHGSTELSAIVLASAAGMSLGRALALPGDLPRLESLKRAGRQAGTLIGGVVMMLIVAGLLEGFARQLVQADLARYAIATGVFLFWCAYLYLPRRRRV